MRNSFFAIFILIAFNSCNDGDVIEVGLEFDQTLALCDQVSNTYLVYDIKQDPYESLSLTFPVSTANNLIFNPAESPATKTLMIDGSSVRFNYRTYSGNPENLLCALIPDPTVTILNNYEATSGTVTILTTFTDDDEDGIPSSVEDLNTDGDNDPATDPTDRDGDGIPDYKDADDDNDNILTKFENVNYSVADGLTLALNTDGDDFANYLDADDDGDGIPTKDEDEDGNKNPRDDFDEASLTPDTPRYLDATANEPFIVNELVANTFKRSFVLKFTLTQIDIQILSTDIIELGEYKYSVIIQ